MNEYMINIPLNDYEKLKMCELKLKESYIEKLLDLSSNLASLNFRSCEYHEIVVAQNALLEFIRVSKHYEIGEYPR